MSIATRSSRRKTLVSIERGNLWATGATKTEAKANLEPMIDQALSGSYDPVILHCGSNSCLVWRTPTGWTYRIQWSDQRTDGLHEIRSPGSQHYTRDQAISKAGYHLVTLSLDHDVIHTDEDIPSYVSDPRDRNMVLSQFKFYRAWRWAKANIPGMADEANNNELHRWACDHQYDERFA